MPVFIAVVRVAWCCICNEQWYLEAGEKPPEHCKICGTADWMWGPESRDSRFIRMRIKRLAKVKNPGAKSRARQERGRKYAGDFRKPKDGTA